MKEWLIVLKPKKSRMWLFATYVAVIEARNATCAIAKFKEMHAEAFEEDGYLKPMARELVRDHLLRL